MIATETQTPHGYRRADRHAGLLVPSRLARDRDVWPWDEKRVLDRAAALCKAHGVAMILRCGRPECSEPDLAGEARPGGSFALTCGCTERVFERGL